jgi:hypothetical protein
MYTNLKNTTQIVRIDSVNTSKNEVHCVSKDGGRFTLRMPIASGVYRIPVSGENWIVRRQDLTNWYFEGVVPDNDPYGSAAAQPGDVIIEAPTNLKISADYIYINNSPLGVWDCEEIQLTSNASEITMSETPIQTVIQVFNNGLLIPPSGIIIREQTLLFEEPLTAGSVVIYYMRLPER